MCCEGQTVVSYCADKLELKGLNDRMVLNYLAVNLELN